MCRQFERCNLKKSGKCVDSLRDGILRRVEMCRQFERCNHKKSRKCSDSLRDRCDRKINWIGKEKFVFRDAKGLTASEISDNAPALEYLRKVQGLRI